MYHPKKIKLSPVLPMTINKSSHPGEWLVERCNPRLEQRHVEDGTSKAAPSTGPTVGRWDDRLPCLRRLGAWVGRFGLVTLESSQETERNWLKNALQCELNQLKLGNWQLLAWRCQQLWVWSNELRFLFACLDA